MDSQQTLQIQHQTNQVTLPAASVPLSVRVHCMHSPYVCLSICRSRSLSVCLCVCRTLVTMHWLPSFTHVLLVFSGGGSTCGGNGSHCQTAVDHQWAMCALARVVSAGLTTTVTVAFDVTDDSKDPFAFVVGLCRDGACSCDGYACPGRS